MPVGTILPDPLAGATVNADPVHIAAVVAITEGVGSTVTATVKVDPAHDPEVGVTV